MITPMDRIELVRYITFCIQYGQTWKETLDELVEEFPHYNRFQLCVLVRNIYGANQRKTLFDKAEI